jgi:hypothetical protein
MWKIYRADYLKHRRSVAILALGHPPSEVLEESVQTRETLIAGARMIVALRFEVAEKPEHPLEGEILEGESGDLPARLGARCARELGVTEKDVERLIHECRREARGGRRG